MPRSGLEPPRPFGHRPSTCCVCQFRHRGILSFSIIVPNAPTCQSREVHFDFGRVGKSVPGSIEAMAYDGELATEAAPNKLLAGHPRRWTLSLRWRGRTAAGLAREGRFQSASTVLLPVGQPFPRIPAFSCSPIFQPYFLCNRRAKHISQNAFTCY